MWSVHLIRTVTGEVGPRVDAVSGSWSIELNKIESGNIKIRKADLARWGAEWWAPWSGGVLFVHHGPDGVDRPIAAGPITGWSAETADDLTLDWSGIREILAHRVIAQDLKFTGMSLGTIAWRVVHDMSEIKPGGSLPIVHGSPEETVTDDADHQRTYEAWNLANNGIDKRLTELSEVIGGPDIMFRPQWANDEHTLLVWAMVHGTEGRPRIAQTWTADMDTTAPRAGLSDLSVKSEASHIVTRVWATGSGEGAGVARTYVQDLDSLGQWAPFTEKVISDNDQSDTGKLRVKAQGELAASKEMLDQLTMSMRADSVKHPVGRVQVGDAVNVTLKGWVSIPDGLHTMRLISMSGGLDEKVTLDFQQDSWQ